MQFIKKIIIALTLLISLITFAQSETTWITKKKDKSKKVEKVEKKETVSSWIKKKKKENKKKFKETEKESKTWITKKSKTEKKLEKKILKQYLEIAVLPEANFYFSAKSESGQIVYGYVNADKKSDLIDLGGTSYFSLSNGYAYLDDGKTTCTVNSQLGLLFGSLAGKVVVECVNQLKFTGNFVQQTDVGIGSGQTNKGDIINFKFTQFKNKNLAYFKAYKEQNTRIAGQPPTDSNEVIEKIKPTGNYYALLIGNSKYEKWASLTSPSNDVKEIGKILKNKYKFKDVQIVEDVNRFELFDKLKKLKGQVTPNDYVLIYYSGHGEQDSQRGYWIPVNGEKEWDPEWIDSITVVAAIQRIKAKHILLMVDSCYLGSSMKGDSKEVELTEAEWNIQMANKALKYRAGLVLSSGGETPVTDAVIDDKHSMFAYKFIDILKKNDSFISSSDIYLTLKRYHAKHTQTPQFYGVANWGHLDGDFIFISQE